VSSLRSKIGPYFTVITVSHVIFSGTNNGVTEVRVGYLVSGGQEACTGCRLEVCMTQCFSLPQCLGLDYDRTASRCYLHGVSTICGSYTSSSYVTHISTRQCGKLYNIIYYSMYDIFLIQHLYYATPNTLRSRTLEVFEVVCLIHVLKMRSNFFPWTPHPLSSWSFCLLCPQPFTGPHTPIFVILLFTMSPCSRSLRSGSLNTFGERTHNLTFSVLILVLAYCIKALNSTYICHTFAYTQTQDTRSQFL